MKTPPENKTAPGEASDEKKKTRKYALIFIAVIAVVFSAIWFGGELLASETVLSTSPITLNGKERLLKFSEKRGGRNAREARVNEGSSGIRHYAYYLELSDPGGNSSLCKTRFKSPVSKIQSAPMLIATSAGTAWLVSTTGFDRESPGYVLKFSVSDAAITPMEFDLEERYKIRKVDGNKVFLSEGTNPATAHTMGEGVYLDLETGEVVYVKN